MKYPTLNASVLCVLLFEMGCGKNAPQPTQAVQAPPATAGQPHEDTVPLREDYLNFAKSLEEAVTSGDSNAVQEMFDTDAMLLKATSGFGLSDRSQRSFIAGLKSKSTVFSGGFGKLLTQAVSQGGSYKFLRLDTGQEPVRALFRLTSSKNRRGLNYHELILKPTIGGQIKAIDLYVFLAGELMSETMRAASFPFIAGLSPDLLKHLTEADREYVECCDQLKLLAEMVQAGKTSEAIKVLHELPTSVQARKSLLLFSIKLSPPGSDESLAALERLRQLHPDDPSTDLVALHLFAASQNYDKALECVERLNKSLGGDPLLEQYIFDLSK